MSIPIDSRNMSFAQVIAYRRHISGGDGSTDPSRLIQRVLQGGVTADEYRAVQSMRGSGSIGFETAIGAFLNAVPNPAKNLSEAQVNACVAKLLRATPREQWTARTAEDLFNAVSVNGLTRTEYYALRQLRGPAPFTAALTSLLQSHVPAGLPGSTFDPSTLEGE